MIPCRIPGVPSGSLGSGDRFGAGANGEVAGILTDRDIVIRGLAESRDPESVLAEISAAPPSE